MPWSLHHPTCIFSHIEYMLALIQLRKETQIKLILINFLQLFSCVMVWSLNYRTASPYVSTVLGILSIVTLGWLSLCQQRHIEKLGKALYNCVCSHPLTTLTKMTVYLRMVNIGVSFGKLPRK